MHGQPDQVIDKTHAFQSNLRPDDVMCRQVSSTVNCTLGSTFGCFGTASNATMWTKGCRGAPNPSAEQRSSEAAAKIQAGMCFQAHSRATALATLCVTWAVT